MPQKQIPQGGPSNLQQVLERIQQATEGSGRITFGQILDTIGSRSFGVWFLLAGVITLAPVIGDIPGVPTVIAVFVILTAVQLLMRRDRFWMPQWIVSRSVARSRMDRSLRWMQRPARFVDRFVHPRLTIFVQNGAVHAIAGVCLVLALLMPVMEVVPFSANGAGATLTAFGLSLTARDGLMAILGYVFAFIIFSILVVVLV